LCGSIKYLKGKTTPWLVNGNSKGVEALKSQNILRKVGSLTRISKGVVEVQTKKPPAGKVHVWIFSGTTHC